MNDDSKAMASEPLEGFHEVNLASPTTPDLHGLVESYTPKCSAIPSTLYRTPALNSGHGPPNALRADQLPTQPVYSTPKHLGTEDPHNGCVPGLEVHLSACGSGPSARLGVESSKGGTLGSIEGEEPIGLSTDTLSHLRSPSVMEVREKGYERLKEELAKAQRLSDNAVGQ
ncbi:hypothetical protein SKAU_G00021670 [Synaphobranchus kaupii]|uniref:Uncharacterized protein n=1 Tax=Synaphobranchus kaupii TaxID=118154 RepID=A0A9Q1JEN4_SYNKA|nr:hypothetical protein SKAU_G00021670 [Synaphobranchus kaupii]